MEEGGGGGEGWGGEGWIELGLERYLEHYDVRDRSSHGSSFPCGGMDPRPLAVGGRAVD